MSVPRPASDVARALHQPAERHARRARRLAAAALHAGVHEAHERVVGLGAVASAPARIAAMRPRGDAASSPVTRYVGQCGRQSPHATHAASSSSTTPSFTACCVIEPDVGRG